MEPLGFYVDVRTKIWRVVSEIRLKRKRGMGSTNSQACKDTVKSYEDRALWGEGLQMKAESQSRASAVGRQRQAGCRNAKQTERTRVPLVPIHSWSCSSLKVSLTFPPDLLYMPDKGTVGRRSWRHKSTVRKGGTVGQWEGNETELEAMIIGSLNCGTGSFQGLKKQASLPGHP